MELWVSAKGADDTNLFVVPQKFDAGGNEVTCPYYMQFDDGLVALGWLRVSHRELDVAQSTSHQPVFAHRRELKLKPGEIVPVEIEIWPSGTLFHAGESLRLLIQGSDVKKYPRARAEQIRSQQQHQGEKAPPKYWLSTLPETISFRRLVDLAKSRWRIERDYQELKQEVGLGHYEGRGWRRFHHHATLCIAAYGSSTWFIINMCGSRVVGTDRV